MSGPPKTPAAIKDSPRASVFHVWLWAYLLTLVGLFVGSAIILTLIIVGLIVAARYWKASDPIQFVTSNLLSALIFMAILVQAGIYVLQAVIYDQQRRIMKQTVENADISERAYIGLIDMRLIEPLVAEQPIKTRITFQNGGRTPAWNFRSRCRMVISNETTAEIVKRYPVENVGGEGGSFIPSGQPKSVIVPFDFRLTQPQLMLVNDRTVRLLVLIFIKFNDFQGTVQPFHFRAVYEPDAGTFLEETYEEEEKKAN